jgi:hypothetical protein
MALPSAFASGPASDQPRDRILGTCIRFSLPAPALWRCLWLGLRLANCPALIWSPARAFSSTSGLNLQLLTACRFSGRRRASVRTRVLRLPPPGFHLFLRPPVSPSVRPPGRFRGLRSQAESLLRACAPRIRSTLLPPSGSGTRRWASTPRLLPFLPASLLACLSPAFGSRLCAFVPKRPSGMPLTLRCPGLAPIAPSDPRADFQSLRSSLGTPAIGLWLVPPQTAPALRPSPLAAANSQRPVDHRALDPRRLAPV